MGRDLRYLAVLVLVLGLGRAGAEVVIDYDTTIDYPVDEEVRIIAGGNPNPPTVVELAEPAVFNGTVRVFDSSIVNIRGAELHGHDENSLVAYDASTVNLYWGRIEAELTAVGSSTVNVYGGYVDDADTGGSAIVNIYAGWVGGPNATDLCTVNVFGGDIDGVRATDSGTVNIRGGNILQEVRAGAGFGVHDGVVTLYGTGFNYPYGPIPDRSGTLTGVLADGNSIDVPFEIYSDASIVLAPEPASILLLSVAAVGLLARRRREH